MRALATRLQSSFRFSKTIELSVVNNYNFLPDAFLFDTLSFQYFRYSLAQLVRSREFIGYTLQRHQRRFREKATRDIDGGAGCQHQNSTGLSNHSVLFSDAPLPPVKMPSRLLTWYGQTVRQEHPCSHVGPHTPVGMWVRVT